MIHNQTSGTRQSNIELLRIVCMILILALHANYLVYGMPTKEYLVGNPSISLLRITAYQLCVVAVNCFVFISGWFTIKPSLKKAATLILQTIEYGLGLSLVFLLFGYPVSLAQFGRMLFVGEYYWFIIAYLQLFILSPILNYYVENTSEKQLRNTLFLWLAFEFIYGWIGGEGNYADGYSGIHFIGIYLIARYLRKYKLSHLSIAKSLS